MPPAAAIADELQRTRCNPPDRRFTGAVQLLGAFEDDSHIYLVQESCAGAPPRRLSPPLVAMYSCTKWFAKKVAHFHTFCLCFTACLPRCLCSW